MEIATDSCGTTFRQLLSSTYSDQQKRRRTLRPGSSPVRQRVSIDENKLPTI